MVTTKQRQDSDESEGQGFASMDPERQREIASRGGKAAHESGNAHEFDSEEAREAGRKGGRVAHQSGNAHEFDSEEAREAGRQSHKNDDDDHHRSSRSRSSRDDDDDRKGNRRGQQGRGFVGMDPERQREIASKGGRAAHRSGRAH